MSFSKHQQVCIKGNKDYHKYAVCPLRAHVCNKCKSVMRTMVCKRCRDKARKGRRNEKFVGLQPQFGDSSLLPLEEMDCEDSKNKDLLMDWEPTLEPVQEMDCGETDVEEPMDTTIPLDDSMEWRERDNFVNLEGQVGFTHNISQESLTTIETMLKQFVGDLTMAVPVACLNAYEKMKVEIMKDCNPGSKPETLVSVFSSLILLVRSLAGANGPDWINVGLVITQFLSGYGVFGACAQWVVDKFMKLKGYFGKKKETSEPQVAYDKNGCSINVGTGDDDVPLEGQMNVGATVACLLGMVHVIIFKAQPNWKSLVTFVTQTSRIPMVCNGLSSLFESCGESGRLLKSWVMRAWLGADVCHIEKVIDPYTKWCDDVDVLFRCASRRDFVWNLVDLQEFDKLYDEGIKLRKETVWLNKDKTLAVTYNTRMAMLVKLQDEVNKQNVRQRTRLEPFLLNFWGESGLGKSLLTPTVVVDYMVKYHPDEFKRLKHDHNACVYTRKSGDARWDGVGKQRIIVYDDFMQVKDSLNNPSTELFEMIELSNSAPFNPLMAELEKKGKVRLEPEMILLTSNVMKPEVKSLQKPIAVYRRFDMIWEVLPHPDVIVGGVFCKEKMLLRHKDDLCACGDPEAPVCLDANVFQRWKVEQFKNAETPKLVECRFVQHGEPVDQKAMLKQFHIEMAAHRRRTTGKLKFFKSLGEKLMEKREVELEGQMVQIPWPAWPMSINRPDPYPCDEHGRATDHDGNLLVSDDDDESLKETELKETNPDFYQYLFDTAEAHCSKDPGPTENTGFQDSPTIKRIMRETLDFEESKERAEMKGSLTKLKELSGSLFGGLQVTKSWMRGEVERLFAKAKSFVENHPVVSAFAMAAVVVGAVYGASKLTDDGADNDWVGETDDSIQKMEGRRKGRTTWRAENDDSLRDSKNRRSGKSSWRGEGSMLQTATSKVKSGLSWKNMKRLLSDMKDTDVELVGQGVSDPNLPPLMKKVYKQTYILESNQGVRLGSAVVLTGRIVLTFRHCLGLLQDKKFRLRNLQTGATYEMNGISRYEVCSDAGDLMLMEGPRGLPQGCNIIDSVVSDFTACEHTNLNVRLMVPGVDVTKILVGEAKAQDTIIKYSVLTQDVVLRNHYLYRFDTERGYCGSLLFQSNKKDSCKIIGMHVCGSGEASMGLSSALCREALEEAIGRFSLEAQCAFPLDDYKSNLSIPSEKLEPFGYSGKAPTSITDQKFTKIKRSPLHGWDGQPIKEPAQLCGEWNGVNVKDVARDKLRNSGFKAKNAMHLELARKTVGYNVKKNTKVRPKLWTLEEAAFGSDDKFCEALDMTTSSGMPWKTMTKKPGKKGFLNKKTSWIRPDLKDAVVKRIEKAKNNERVPTIWSDHYKDELRLPAKVHKPRLFSGAALDFTLTVRMYFGQWCSAVMDGRIQNEVAVGINPHGDEWTVLGHKLKDENMMCGDFKNYGGSLDPDIMWAVLDMINEWYNDEHQELRKVLFADIVNATHQSGSLLYTMDHSNPDGNPLTALLNSIYQLIALMYTMLQMGKSLREIQDRVKKIVYGDDNVISVTGGESFLPLKEFTEALRDEVGLTMTNSDKTGPPVYTTIENVDFLGRKFRFEDGRYYAPRPWENLSLVFHWCKSEMPWNSIAEAYSEVCFHELSHYPEQDFKVRAAQIQKLYEERGYDCVPLYSINFYRDGFQKWAGSGREMMLCWGL